MMRSASLKMLCVAWLFAMLSPDGQAANPVGNISISPSSPTGAWSCTLKPNESASLTICVAPEGVVRGVRYVLKGDPVYPVLGQTEDFLWYGSAGNYAICNLKGETASAVVTVTCVWEPESKAGTGGGGKGNSQRPPDITGPPPGQHRPSRATTGTRRMNG